MRQWKSPRRMQHQTSWRTHMRQQTRDIMEDHCVLAASSLAARTANTTNLESRQTRTTHKDHFLAARSRAARIIACDKSNSEQHGACTQRMITIFHLATAHSINTGLLQLICVVSFCALSCVRFLSLLGVSCRDMCFMLRNARFVVFADVQQALLLPLLSGWRESWMKARG